MDKPKRILILTNDTGFGHRSAANAVAEAIREKYPDSCKVEIVNPLDDERAPSILRDGQEDYDRLVREMPDRYKLRYEFSDSAVPNAIIESALTVMLFPIMRDIVDRHKPDVVVTTHAEYIAATCAVIEVNRLNISFLIVVTDLTNVHRMWFNDASDLILVPTQAARRQALELGIDEDQVQVTGIPVNPKLVREARSKAEIRQELGWLPDLKTVLVVGSKRIKGLEEVLHIINHSALPIQMTLVAGGDDRLFRRLRRTEWHGVVHIYDYVKNMPQMMRASDCIVSKAGGLIITESLACGLPMLLVDITPGQEEGNAEYVIQNGAGMLATDPVKALEELFHWIQNPGLLQEYQERTAALGKLYSAYTIADLVWSAANRGPLSSASNTPSVIPMLLELLHNFGIHNDEPGRGNQTSKNGTYPGIEPGNKR